MKSNPHPFGNSKCGDILFEKLSQFPRDLCKARRVYVLNNELALDLLYIPPRRRAIFAQALLSSRAQQMNKDLRLTKADHKDTVDRLTHLLKQKIRKVTRS